MSGNARRGAVVRIVGAALVGSVALVLAVSGLTGYAAATLDRAHRAYEHELVQRRIDRSLERLVDDVVSASVWDEAVEAIRQDDQAWMQANFGDYYADFMGHDLTVLVGADSQGLYASEASEAVAPDRLAGLVSVAADLVAAASVVQPPYSGLDAVRPQRAILVYQGAPYLVAAAPVVGEDATATVSPSGTVIVSARRVSSLVNDLERDLGLTGVRLSQSGAAAGETAIPLLSGPGVDHAIVWTPARPGFGLLDSAAPWLAVALLLLVAALLSGGLKVRALLAQLAANEADLKASLDEAERANAAKSRFLANMSHELRTPLNGVIAMAELLQARQAGDEAREMAQTLVASGRMLRSVVDDVLDVARIEAGRVTLEDQPFDLAVVALNIADLHAAAAKAKGVALRSNIRQGMAFWVRGDGDRVGQILSNLIGNAVKFTDAGRVELRLRRDSRGVTLVVADTGVGFEGEAADHLFKPFEQADDSISRRFGGTGLGLAISRALTEAMGGRIRARSIPGRGAVFRVRLPLPPGAQPEETPETSSPDPEVAGMRILCVDDHPVNRRVIELILATVEASVTMAEDGQQALDAFSAGRFDVILMDLQMPVMDGLTAIREIRAREMAAGLPRTAIIAVTANGMPSDVAASAAAGADAHLTKPISPPALLAALAQTQGPGEAVPEEVAA